jgi:hypothetical protein
LFFKLTQSQIFLVALIFQIVFPGYTDVDVEHLDIVTETDNDPNTNTIDFSEKLDIHHAANETLKRFGGCLVSGIPSISCSLEVTLLVIIAILLVQEIIQCFSLGIKRYFTEFENFIELTALILAAVGLFVQFDMILLKWLSAIGICFAYLELIFLMGRYPFLGGAISLMFYRDVL